MSSHNTHDGDGMEAMRAEQHAKFHGKEIGNMHESLTKDGVHNPELYTGGVLGKPHDGPTSEMGGPAKKSTGGTVKAVNMVGGSPD